MHSSGVSKNMADGDVAAWVRKGACADISVNHRNISRNHTEII